MFKKSKTQEVRKIVDDWYTMNPKHRTKKRLVQMLTKDVAEPIMKKDVENSKKDNDRNENEPVSGVKATLHFDGGYTYGEPYGTYGYHFKIAKGNHVIKGEDGGTFIPEDFGVNEVTNNVAEYAALLKGIRAIKEKEDVEYMEIFGDSKMVVKMVIKEWGWKKGRWQPHPDYPHIRKMLEDIIEELDGIAHDVKWIPREQNMRADELATN